ncbi:MAG: hypothetical protein ABEL76_02335 [Bradymonadaceae bacterium]
MTRGYLRTASTDVLTLLVLICATDAPAHEPVFSPGPHTIYKGGAGAAVTAESTFDGGREGPIRLRGDFSYGLTADLQLSAGVPVLVARQADHGPSTAVGDSVAQLKWRPWKNAAKGRVDSLSLLGAVKLPTGHHDVSKGNTGYTFGATIAREHLRYYLFGSALYTMQTAGVGGTKPGDVVEYNLAAGLRPVVLEYDQPDAVVLVELNGTTARPPQTPGSGGSDANGGHHGSGHQTLRAGLSEDDEYGTVRQAHTGGATDFTSGGAGGTELAVSPELLLSWGPVMLKGGVQFPFFDTFNSPRPDFRVKSSLIVQF